MRIFIAFVFLSFTCSPNAWHEQTANCKCKRPIEHLAVTCITRYHLNSSAGFSLSLFLFRFLYHRWIWGPIRRPCCHWPSVAVPSSEVSPSLNMVHSIKQAPHFYPTHTLVKLLKSVILGCGQQKKKVQGRVKSRTLCCHLPVQSLPHYWCTLHHAGPSDFCCCCCYLPHTRRTPCRCR